MPVMENHENLPEELRNKEKVVFGNLSELLTFHQSSFIKELEECEDTPESLAEVFLKSVRRLLLFHLTDVFTSHLFNTVFLNYSNILVSIC